MPDRIEKMRLGIIANTGKQLVAGIMPPFLDWLAQEGIDFVLASDLGKIIKVEGYNLAAPTEVAHSVDFVLSFGGDGTLLQTANLIAPSKTPVVGINLGAFGYLAEVNIEQRDNSPVGRELEVQVVPPVFRVVIRDEYRHVSSGYEA